MDAGFATDDQLELDMAAGKFFVYNTALKHIIRGNINLETDTIVAYPLHSGYVPATASHSALAQITPYQASAGGAAVASRVVTGSVVTGSGAAQVKWDLDDILGFSAGGSTFQCKYVALVAQSASAAGIDNLLIGFFDTETTAATGVEGSQLNVNWNAGGVTTFNSNQ